MRKVMPDEDLERILQRLRKNAAKRHKRKHVIN